MKKVLNTPPTDLLEVFVFDEGTSGELGSAASGSTARSPLTSSGPVSTRQPEERRSDLVRWHARVAALTKDNKILTWGVNDQGALGRDTNWGGGLKDTDDDDSDDEDDTGLNPRESNPAEVDTENVPHDTIWTQVVASDSASFALDTKGDVYGWGTFRVSSYSLPGRAICNLYGANCVCSRATMASLDSTRKGP